MSLTRDGSFRHQAILYAGVDDFVSQATTLLDAALEQERPILVALTPGTLRALRESLGETEQRVRWVDITRIGRNPARIVPLWREFLALHREDGRSRPVFGIGQPIYPQRAPAEMVEAERHEALLNLAFAGTSGFDLYCPYDLGTLDARAVSVAERTHPHLQDWEGLHASSGYREVTFAEVAGPRLAAVGQPSCQLWLDGIPAAGLHNLVLGQVSRLAVGEARWEHLALAAVALAGAIGGEELRIWSEPGLVLVEVRGRVPITDPLAGREWPAPAAEPEHGLWLANQLCDLVQWRSDGQSSLVRLQVADTP